jgi:uncharacterized spore protein YtfJ
MDEKKEKNAFTTFDVQNNEDPREVFEQFIAVAHVDSVFGQPLTIGEYTVITASEVSVAMGIGYGKGYGTYPAKGEGEVKEQSGAGGGGGGGGISLARPVATISIGPKGATATPVLDFTKIYITLITVLGSMVLVFLQMLRRSKKTR